MVIFHKIWKKYEEIQLPAGGTTDENKAAPACQFRDGNLYSYCWTI